MNNNSSDNDSKYSAKNSKSSFKKSVEANKKISKVTTPMLLGGAGGKVANSLGKTKLGDKLYTLGGMQGAVYNKFSKHGKSMQKMINDLDDKGALDNIGPALGAAYGKLSDNATNQSTTNQNANMNNLSEEQINNLMQSNNLKEEYEENKLKRSLAQASGAAKQKIKSKLLSFIAANPWVLAIALAFLILFIVLLVVLGGFGAGGAAGYGAELMNQQNNADIGFGFAGGCSQIPMKSTPLSKEEFVSRVKSYFSSNNTSAGSVFSAKADTIYDIASKNGVNPELVVIRAIAEGFTPGLAYNNYWGMGTYNGTTGGIKYASFDAGVLGYVQNVSQYSTAAEMMSRYAYIGNYWYNPGGPGDGGCYYYPYLKKYLSEERAATVGSYCSGSSCSISNTSGCSKTTEEDQLAYASYQVEAMVAIRQRVFGIGEAECEEEVTGFDGGGGSIPGGNPTLNGNIEQMGRQVASKAIATFDNYQYSQSKRGEVGYVDCSSMVARAYALFGINYFSYGGGYWGTTYTERDWCSKHGVLFTNTSTDNLIPGDLIFFSDYGHVEMYVGNGQKFGAHYHSPDNPAYDVSVVNYTSGSGISACRPLQVYLGG